MKPTILLALSATLLHTVPSHAGDVAAFRQQQIQGDVQAALRTTQALPEKDAAALACIRTRFAAPPVPAGGTGAAVLDAYRGYWHQVLLAPAERMAAEVQLLRQLNGILPGDGWDRSNLDATTTQARRFLEQQGLHAITGVTRPNYELMVWAQETRRTWQVALPERDVTVPVVFLDGFQSKGWLSYASCDRFGAGGWTANGTLYALADRYDTQSEDFRVSYLGHEGQHFADNEDFPQLEQPELEYRAKLTELVLSGDPAPLLDRFAQTAHAGRAVPHLHAEYWLVRRMRERTSPNAGADALHAAARRLLQENSTAARALDARTVTRTLPD